jgi:hypothetical protein
MFDLKRGPDHRFRSIVITILSESEVSAHAHALSHPNLPESAP